MKPVLATSAVVAAAAVAFGIGAGSAAAKAVPPWQRCAQVNAKYPHGVGKVGARDHTSDVPVTTFKRSNRLYAIAMQNNKGLDRDRDGIACEQG